MTKTTKTIKDPRSLSTLLEAGLHFGHHSRRWNPKIAPFIFATKKGIHIFDLAATNKQLGLACELVKQVAASDGEILFVCTKRQAKSIVKDIANSIDMPFVSNRWLGGTFTNFGSVQNSIRRFKYLKNGLENDLFSKNTKKERVMKQREFIRLERLVGGIANMDKIPALMVVIDIKREKTAIAEAKSMGVPVIALVDSNSDPNFVDIAIPGNDDGYRSIKLILETLRDAVLDTTAPISQEPIVKKASKADQNIVVEEDALVMESVEELAEKAIQDALAEEIAHKKEIVKDE